MYEEQIITEFVRTRYNSGPGEEEMLGDTTKMFGPSVVLGRGCENLCLESPEEREKKIKRIKTMTTTNIYGQKMVQTLLMTGKLCDQPLRKTQRKL
jgi:hypothetical protein